MSLNIVLNLLTCGMILSSSLHAANGNGKSDSATKPRQETKGNKKWKTFTSTQGNFSAEFPTEPQSIDQKIDIPKTDLSIQYQTFLSEPHENVVYVVSVWTYPPEIDMSRPEVNLQDGFGGMMSALPGAEVLVMELTTFEGADALEFKVKSDDIIFEGMLILSQNILYQVFTVYKASDEKEVDYKRFIQSFHLLEQTDKQAQSNSKAKVKKARKLKI